MANVKISQLIKMDSDRSLPVTNAVDSVDELVVNDISSLVTKRVEIHDIIYMRNRNINDTPDGSQVTGNLGVTGSVTFGTSLKDKDGNSISDLSTLVTETALQTLLQTLLGVDPVTGLVRTLNCLRDSTPTRSGVGCGVTVTGELTVDSDLYVGGTITGDGTGITNIQLALRAITADSAYHSLLSDDALRAENAVRADSAYHSMLTEEALKIRTRLSNSDGTFYPTFVGITPGVDSVRTDQDFKYNPNNGILQSTFFSGDGSLLTNVVASIGAATQILADSTTVDANHYVMFRRNGSGQDSVNVDPSFRFNPVTNVMTGLNDSDLYLRGGAKWAEQTDAKVATGVNYIMVRSSTEGYDSVGTDAAFSYNATTETLSVTNFSGDGSSVTNVDAASATNASNVAVTAVSDNAIYYPHIGSASSGNDDVNVSTSLQFNPAENNLKFASDTNKLSFGADDDMTVTHDGTNATIDNQTGALNVTNSTGTSVIILSNLPTADPVNAGQLWNDAGTLKISAG
jgi:hypothetical protein